MYEDLITTNAGASPLLGLMKIDQLAFLARTDQDEAAIKNMLRLSKARWITDTVVAKGYVRGGNKTRHDTFESVNTATLQFNYDLGIEVEILRYTEGHNYPDEGKVQSCHLCHVGFHINRGKELPKGMPGFVFQMPIIQEVWTQTHTNEYLLSTGRKYHYTIYDTKPLLGVYLKVIERIEL